MNDNLKPLLFDQAVLRLMTRPNMPPECLPDMAARLIPVITALSEDEKIAFINAVVRGARELS